MSTPDDKSMLRKRLRAQRRAFKGSDRWQAEASICQLLRQLMDQNSHREQGRNLGKYIAAYYPFDGEVDLRPLWGGGGYTSSLQESSMHVENKVNWAFPVHQAQQALSFVSPVKWTKTEKLPVAKGSEVSLLDIGMIVLPGVAFCNQTGLRLGLGGGHYDRTLALAEEKSWSGLTFGVGFSFQIQAELPSDPWDYPLDGLVTELGVKMFAKHLNHK